MKKNLVLLGMMGVGKTTLGKIVSKKQGLTFIDTDKIIEKKNLMKISEIFKKKGESFFRTEEEKEVLNLIQKKACVLALGGGAFINKKVRDAVLKKTISIWLDGDLKILNKRIKWNKNRPLLNTKNSLTKINELYNKRKSIYKLANYKINCKSLSKKEIVNKIISLYESTEINN